MNLQYKNWWYKVKAVGRYLIAKIYYWKRLESSQLSMIGKDCGVHIFKEGKIACKGRIIMGDYTMLYAKGEILIGENLGVNKFSRIVAHEKIEIGNNVTIGQMVSILDHDHGYKMTDNELQLDGYSTAPIKIGNNIWIGDKCTILKGVTIKDNVVIGANTLVHKDVPSGVVIGGVPFKILKQI